MKITIITVGKLKEKYLKMAVDEYSKRLSKYCKLEIVEVSDEKAPENLSISQEITVKTKEGERILKHIKQNSHVIALAIEGQQKTSEQLADNINQLGINGKSHLTFIIGGSLGLAENIINRADEKLSFSKMTFPHQLMRVILLEQIYRSYRIINGEPYHK